jgi:hypothetical protein
MIITSCYHDEVISEVKRFDGTGGAAHMRGRIAWTMSWLG